MSHRVALLTVPLAVASLALAACGGGDDPDLSSGTSDRQEMREAALDFAECMRENGVDMKDPTQGGGIMLQAGPGSGNSEATVRKAREACEEHLEGIEPPELSEEQQREFKEQALKFARCMREHGIDMPDPTFGEDGRVTQRLGGPGGGGIDPEDPRFQEAQEECSQYQPRGRMERDAQ